MTSKTNCINPEPVLKSSSSTSLDAQITDDSITLDMIHQ
jgi:hypothetical protein